MKCLLIGGGGFIGHNISKRMEEKGYAVTVWDIASNSFESGSGINYCQVDYFSAELTAEQLEDQDYVILLACSVSPQSSMEYETGFYGKDVSRMIYLLDLIKKAGHPRLVFISSGGTVYGNTEIFPITEDMPTNPISHYGILKLTQEKIALMYNELYGMKNIVLRLANPYGWGQKIASGVGAVTSFLECIMKGEKIKIYGDGNAIRDYILISDVAEMVCRLLNRNVYDEEPIYNIGTEKGAKLNEIVHSVEELVGKKADIIYYPNRIYDVSKNVLCNRKIKRAIGEYECVPLQKGIELYYEQMCLKVGM